MGGWLKTCAPSHFFVILTSWNSICFVLVCSLVGDFNSISLAVWFCSALSLSLLLKYCFLPCWGPIQYFFALCCRFHFHLLLCCLYDSCVGSLLRCFTATSTLKTGNHFTNVMVFSIYSCITNRNPNFLQVFMKDICSDSIDAIKNNTPCYGNNAQHQNLWVWDFKDWIHFIPLLF